MINKLSILGVGLIGGSLAKALRASGFAGEIVGFGRSLGALDLAMELGVIDRAAVNAADAVRDADMVVLAVPVGSMHEMLEAIAPALPAHAVVTDVGSVKCSVIADAARALGEHARHFVAGHPLAGLEQSGVAAAREDLYRGKRVVLTPSDATEKAAVDAVNAMWRATGADVVVMTPEQHDRVLAASSHLPHVLAYTLVDMLVRRDDHSEVFACAAGGFRDFTRIAASDPVMWRDICFGNREALVEVLRQYQDELAEMLRAIEEGDGEWLHGTFSRAKHARDGLNKKIAG